MENAAEAPRRSRGRSPPRRRLRLLLICAAAPRDLGRLAAASRVAVVAAAATAVERVRGTVTTLPPPARVAITPALASHNLDRLVVCAGWACGALLFGARPNIAPARATEHAVGSGAGVQVAHGCTQLMFCMHAFGWFYP